MTGSKPKILIVIENWVDCDPGRGLSAGHHNFIGSLRATGLAEDSEFFLDVAAREVGTERDAALISACEQAAPDLVFLRMVQGIDVNPRAETVRKIRDDLSIPVVAAFSDMSSERSVAWMDSFADAVTQSLLVDCYSVYPNLVSDRSIYRPTWMPQDPKIFYPGDSARDLDVSFVGSVARYPDRKLAIGLLAATGIDVFQAGGEAEAPLTVEDYAEVLRHSKIALNFARPVFDEPNYHCKGRVMEATNCGALLMEQRNLETAYWLEEDQEYVAFNDERELIEKTRYYLSHDAERMEIATAGAHRVHAEYSAEKYWRQVLETISSH